jgi:hypothetical protein
MSSPNHGGGYFGLNGREQEASGHFHFWPGFPLGATINGAGKGSLQALCPEGQPHRFQLSDSFWKGCPEFRDSGTTVIREWLRRHYTLDWPKGEPPQVELVQLDGNRFRLTSP